MARTAKPSSHTLDLHIDHDAIDADVDALNILSSDARQVIQTYGLQTANVGVLTLEIKAYQQAAVDALFQIGARLLLLRTLLVQGEWFRTLDGLGMDPRAARKIIQATIKYTSEGKQRSEKLLGLGKSKLIELMVLDDDELGVLDQGGQFGELDLDDVARMSVSELRKALRESRMDKEAKQSLIEAKDQKINDLDVKLKAAKKFKPSPDSEARTLAEQTQLDEIAAAVRALEVGFARLAVVISDALNESSNEALHNRALQALQYTSKRLEECAEQNGFNLKGDDPTTPAWLQG